jgi:hypothetical protein
MGDWNTQDHTTYPPGAEEIPLYRGYLYRITGHNTDEEFELEELKVRNGDYLIFRGTVDIRYC